VPELNTYVKTEQRIPEWCAELTGIVSASNPDSPRMAAPSCSPATTFSSSISLRSYASRGESSSICLVSSCRPAWSGWSTRSMSPEA